MSTQENNNKKRKNIILSVIAILLIISIIIRISYAYWASRVTQSSNNTISSDCLKLEFNDENPIKLEKAYPISDIEAQKLTPYTFTITNTCNLSATYDITLEIMDNENRLASKYVALQVDNDDKKLLSNYESVTPTYSDSNYTAVEAREIKVGILDGGENVTYNIRLWTDGSATSEESMDKYFTSKISVTATRDTTLAKYIQKLATTDTTNLVYDDTTDNNLRYIGADPNNYLCFDSDCSNGKWRVIGVMNNIETATNGTQNLVKIIRADSVGNYAWDENAVNDWKTATLQANLNSGDLYTTYIKNYDSLFETVTWNLGGVSYDEWETAVPSKYYELERGETVYSGHETTWSGKIGLMYPSDYGYATSGGSTTNRKTCLDKSMEYWFEIRYCSNYDYLLSGVDSLTLTPYTDGGGTVFYVDSFGTDIYWNGASATNAVSPVGYLISNTKILSGNGSSETPWIIGA
jgi:hypothetical protein